MKTFDVRSLFILNLNQSSVELGLEAALNCRTAKPRQLGFEHRAIMARPTPTHTAPAPPAARSALSRSFGDRDAHAGDPEWSANGCSMAVPHKAGRVSHGRPGEDDGEGGPKASGSGAGGGEGSCVHDAVGGGQEDGQAADFFEMVEIGLGESTEESALD